MDKNSIRYFLSLATKSRLKIYNVLMKNNYIIHGERNFDIYVSDKYSDVSFADDAVIGLYENISFNQPRKL